MPLNLEIKIKLESLEIYEKKIKDLSAVLIYDSPQQDVYYKVPKGRFKIRNSNGEKSLIYYNRKEDGSERWSDFIVQKVEKPEEFISFFDNFLERLITVKKYRKLYHYNNTRIHLDTVENLGYFIELETKENDGKDKAREEFNFLCKHLDLKLENQIFQSYSDLLLKLKNENISFR